jgi:hypothetical protein
VSEQIFPWPLNVSARGTVNGTEFSISGAGVIRCVGVYHAILNFSRIPPRFHPSAISMFVISTCCEAGASARNGAKNMRVRGAKLYRAQRELTFDQGKITLEGTARYTDEALLLDVEVQGKVDLPDDLCGHSVYFQRVSPASDGTLTARGDGSLYRKSGEEIRISISARQRFEPALSDPLTKSEFRVATEDGVLEGRSYRTTIHSIFDGANSMSLLGDK